MIKYSKNIYRLKEIFNQNQLESRNNDDAFDYEKIKQSKVLAILLAKSGLATTELSRSVTKSLLAGEKSWPRVDGTEHKIEHPISIDELEQHGFVSFYADRCNTHFRTVTDPTLLRPSVKIVYDALIFIRNIRWGVGGLVKIHHKIEKNFAKSEVETIADENYLENISSVTVDKKYYHIQIEAHDFNQTLANFLWASLMSIYDTQIALSKYIDICKTYVADIYVPHFKDQAERNQFSSKFEEYIARDDELNRSWKTISARMKSAELFNYLVISSSTRINISTDITTGISSQETVDGSTEALELDQVVERLENQAPNLNYPIEITEWWDRTDSFFRFYEVFIYSSLFSSLTNDSIAIDRNGISSTKFVPNLIESSSSRETLRHVLFGFLSNMGWNTNFTLYLLATKEYCDAAMYIVIKQLHKKSFEYENESYTRLWWEVAVDEFLHTSVVDNEDQNTDGIIRIIFEIATNINFSNLNKTSKFYLQILNILLNKLEGKAFGLLSEQLVIAIETNQNARNAYTWKLHVLFWVLSNSLDVKKKSQLSYITQNAIYNIYRKNVFEENGTADLSAHDYLDTFPWGKLNDSNVTKAFLGLVKSPKAWIAELQTNKNEGNDAFRNVHILKNYTQILINLFSSRRIETDQTTILNKIIDLVDVLGFEDSPSTVGIFQSYAMSMNETYSVWESICKLIDLMDESQFERFYSIAQTNIPSDRLLVACSMTTKRVRQNKLTDLLVNGGSSTENEHGIAVICDALVLAINLNLQPIVDDLISQGEQQFRENVYLKSSNPRAQYWQDKWLGLKYKVTLAKMVNGNKEYSTELEQKINSVEHTINNSTEIGRKVIQDCLVYRKYIQARILLEKDPQKAYAILNDVCITVDERVYIEERFAAHLRMLDETTSDHENYEIALEEYQNSSKEDNIQRLNDNIVANLIYCFSVVERPHEADRVWSALSNSQRCSSIIAKIYCKELINRSLYETANDVLKAMEEFHETELTDPEVKELILKINKALLSGAKIRENIETIISVSNRVPTSDEMTKTFKIIKSSALEEIAAITTGRNTTKEDFFHIHVMSICNELIHRKKNVQIALAEGVQIEDLISDWFASIFNHRLHMVGISFSDGRGGESASGMGPGEIDGFIRDGANNRVAIMEAFKLTSNNNTVIQEHLDKVAGYSPECLSPIIVLVYCSMKNFNKFSQQYSEDLRSRQYKGFDPINPANFIVRNIENFPFLKVYNEIRLRDSAPVVFNHYLVDLIN